MSFASRRTLALEGIQNCQAATAKVKRFEGHQDPAIQELAKAVKFLSFGAQQIALALTDEGREDDLPIQRAK